jgi:hypothetical protein
MAKASASRGRKAPSGGSSGSPSGGPARTDGPPERQLAVGRPLQARLIALEKRVGLFSEEQSFAADSRFNHPVIPPADGDAPEGMARVFAEDLAALQRLGKSAERCHQVALGPYRVHCLSYFHYDGFRALVYVERDGAFIAAWQDREVLHPDSPRTFLAGVGDAEIEAFLEHIPGR